MHIKFGSTDHPYLSDLAISSQVANFSGSPSGRVGSATDSVTEVDIDLDATAGTFHVFTPNISAAIASKNLYLGAGAACDAALTAFRGTLEIEYSVY